MTLVLIDNKVAFPSLSTVALKAVACRVVDVEADDEADLILLFNFFFDFMVEKN